MCSKGYSHTHTGTDNQSQYKTFRNLQHTFPIGQVMMHLNKIVHFAEPPAAAILSSESASP